MRPASRNLALALSVVAILAAALSPTTRVQASFFLAETYEALGGNPLTDDLADANEVLSELLELSETGEYRAVVRNNAGSAVWIGNSDTKSYFLTAAHVVNSASTNTLTTYAGVQIPPVAGSILHTQAGDFGLLEYNDVLDPELFGGESLILMDLHLANNFAGFETALVGYGNLTIGDRRLGRTRMMSFSNLTRLDGLFRTQSTISSTFDPDKPFAGVSTQGDSGGGVFLNLDGRNILIGALSAGDAMTGMVYTNIYLHREFIDSIVPEGVFTWYTDFAGIGPDTITFQGGDLNNADNWLASDGVTTGFPRNIDEGIISINGSLSIGSAALGFNALGDLVFGGGAVITVVSDFISGNASSSTFNDVTVNVGDDIFTGNALGNLIFNAESVTNVDDDFEANGGGTITINGGTHTTGFASSGGSNFGAQNGSTMNLFGGTVTTGRLRTTDNGNLFGTINVDGDSTIVADSIELSPLSFINFSSDWTGTLTIADQSASSWQAALLATNATLDGVPIDAAIFADSFVLSADGTSLSMCPLGDFDCDGDVDADDIDFYAGNLDLPATGVLAQLDLNEDGVVTLADHNLHITTLVQTSNGQTGTLVGDMNLDGVVDVLNDAFVLVSGLGTTTGGYANGDLNADVVIDVLGDAFQLVANLGQTNSSQ